jgi:hypothetical protein
MFEFLEKSAEEKLEGGKQAYTYLHGNYGRMGVPDPALTLKAPLDEFDAALPAAKDKNTGLAATVRKEAAEKAFEKAFRDYGNEHMEYNPLVTDVDKAMSGYHIPKGTHTPMPVPEDEPEVTPIITKMRQVGFGFRRKGAKRMGKPDGVGACVIRWLISDQPPASFRDLVNIEIVTKSPFTLKFDDADRGKKLWFVACWQINRGRLEGPMTALAYVIIP